MYTEISSSGLTPNLAPFSMLIRASSLAFALVMISPSNFFCRVSSAPRPGHLLHGFQEVLRLPQRLPVIAVDAMDVGNNFIPFHKSISYLLVTQMSLFFALVAAVYRHSERKLGFCLSSQESSITTTKGYSEPWAAWAVMT